MKSSSFLPSEMRALSGLSILYALRMLGLFMVLPILALYSASLSHATPTLIGIALGIYGLTQAVLQIPFGMLSDRLGRKPIIIVGLLILLLGSVIAAESTSLYGIILGRALQGAGAISGVIMALLADQTREEVRTKAMATVGMSIGIAIGASMVIGPIIAHHFGLSGVFFTTALMAVLGLFVIVFLVPSNPVRSHKDVGMDLRQLAGILKRIDLGRLDLSIFALHCILTALFVVLPLKLSALGFSSEQAGWVYLPIMATSFIAMTPLVIIAEKRRKMKPVFVGTVVLIILTLLSMFILPRKSMSLIACLWFFFLAFNLMEAVLPSMISKVAPAGGKGTALGVYSTSQFLGTTLGGTLGGIVATYFGSNAVFIMTALIGLVWLLGIWRMTPPRHLSSLIVVVGDLAHHPQQLLNQLMKIPGVDDAMVVKNEGVAYLKVDKSDYDEQALASLLDKKH
ncbi:MFS transporter [Cernens ardua]|uniref:MFS transporter n=1 Tax=Cernens ardua TaxID=3402176 RepID=UPI003F94FAFE